mmetsp:Transcript_35264/g.80543  ORF Transcript_35264/g.80543 Transcript_35264/m.80543 type:complete len:297 (+) Transcript_35264:4203-5093(+)
MVKDGGREKSCSSKYCAPLKSSMLPLGPETGRRFKPDTARCTTCGSETAVPSATEYENESSPYQSLRGTNTRLCRKTGRCVIGSRPCELSDKTGPGPNQVSPSKRLPNSELESRINLPLGPSTRPDNCTVTFMLAKACRHSGTGATEYCGAIRVLPPPSKANVTLPRDRARAVLLAGCGMKWSEVAGAGCDGYHDATRMSEGWRAANHTARSAKDPWKGRLPPKCPPSTDRVGCGLIERGALNDALLITAPLKTRVARARSIVRPTLNHTLSSNAFELDTTLRHLSSALMSARRRR